MAKKGQRTGSKKTEARGNTRRRRRVLLNLGVPFVQLDQFVNQAEDSFSLGLRVLAETVKEIKDGFDIAEKHNLERQEFEDGRRSQAPRVPWTEVVERAQRLQDIAFDAMSDSLDIAADSSRSMTDAIKDVLKTVDDTAKATGDSNDMRGPLFRDPIVVHAQVGDEPSKIEQEFANSAVARLRIHPQMAPPVSLLGVPPGRKAPQLEVRQLTFEPATHGEAKSTRLTIAFAAIPDDCLPGEYEGVVRAKNFPLMIATVKVHVKPRHVPSSSRATS